MLALKRRLFGAPHDAPKVPEEGPPRHRRKQTDPKRVRRTESDQENNLASCHRAPTSNLVAAGYITGPREALTRVDAPASIDAVVCTDRLVSPVTCVTAAILGQSGEPISPSYIVIRMLKVCVSRSDCRRRIRTWTHLSTSRQPLIRPMFQMSRRSTQAATTAKDPSRSSARMLRCVPDHTMFLMLLVLGVVDLLVHPQEGSVSELSEVCVTVHNDSPPCERTPEADVSDLELDIDDPEESCTDHVSAYSTVELTARQRARFTKMLRKPVSYCQPEGGTTTLKKLLNFKIMGEDGLVKYVRTALDHHDCHTCDAMMLLTSFWSRAVPY